MKTITNVEVKLIRLESNDILTTSIMMCGSANDSEVYVGARGYYDDEEDF